MSKKVAYMYNPEKSLHYISACHPMEPGRINMTHELVQGYGLFDLMKIMKFDNATVEQLKAIQDEDYVDFISKLTPDATKKQNKNKKVFEDNGDCPLFKGLFDYTSSIVGASLLCANEINKGTSDICINWSGGMHHAKKSGASGFCYSNDIVACIMELLKKHQRVMYIDIDVHHGDGVEEYFYNTDRVMTVSFHQGSDFYPGTGPIKNDGEKKGKNHSINVPLKRNIDDVAYKWIFNRVVSKAVDKYKPEAIVMQMGADSVAGDRLGRFNLSSRGHSNCLKFVMGFNIPLIVLGGGGYTTQNVARTWTLATAVALGVELDNKLPKNTLLGLPDKDATLIVEASTKLKRLNSKTELQLVFNEILKILEGIKQSPSAQLQEISKHYNNKDKEEFAQEKEASSIVKSNQNNNKISNKKEPNGEKRTSKRLKKNVN